MENGHDTGELSARQESFCQQYVIDHNGTQAAIRAGYSISGAHVQAARLLSYPKVRRRLAELEEAALARVEVSQEDVIRMLVATYESALKANQHGPAVRAAELLGKRHAMFSDVQVSNEAPSTEDLIAKLKQLPPEAAAVLAPLLGVKLEPEEGEAIH